ncbi:MAG: glycosyltransferase [Candidatus Omnitrophica bacterium]|nr:glycosyltransferase [Candidatus Omnitrophota bacterium]MBD3268629.1 glycosyltransferase [Candidatus Omnitrophota bacterium]
MEISVIIPHYNQPQILQKALVSVYSQGLRDYEVIVVDDASKAEPLESLPKEFEGVKIVRNRQRKGAAYCRNRGVKEADGKYILFMDSDVILEKESLEALKKNMAGSDISYPRIFYTDGRLMYPVEEMHKHFLVLSTVFMIKKDILINYKLEFDETYEIYYEDLDFFIRCYLLGLKMRYVKEARTTHLRGVKDTNGACYRKKRFYLESRNILYAFIKLHSLAKSRNVPLYPNYIFLLRQAAYLIFNVYWPPHAFSYEKTKTLRAKIKLFFGPHEKITRENRLLLLPLFTKSVIWNIVNIKMTLRKKAELAEKIKFE